MGIFGFTCGRCWDYNCECTPQELEEYNKQSEINRTRANEIKVSLTLPNVSPGDIILKKSTEYFIKDIVDGYPIGDVITNKESNARFNVKIREPYKKIVNNT